jgi:hypothetical protein
MTNSSDVPPAPIVFVSYSHDTAEHKRWVGELAAKLVKSGVEVILDQWDTGPGDDLPKFMEKAIGRADRVLLICSDAYVQKADDGQGGAGYEAMIVTGELAKNLAMNKFIPIIRQSHGNKKKPKFLETKYHIDVSEDNEFEERFEELLREIHKTPKHPKPQLGKNPFANERQAEESRAAAPGFRLDLSVSLEIPKDAREAYFAALGFTRNNDKIAWRKFLQKAVSPISKNLLSWRNAEGKVVPQKAEDLPQWVLPGVTSVSPLIAIALAGVESQTEYFSNQVGLIDEFLRPTGWEASGNTIVTRFPEMIAFVYQALLGSVAMQTQQAEIAKRLAWVEIPDFSGARESVPLVRSPKVTGWPESLNHTCTIAWAFLLQLPEHWPWLDELFGDAEHYKAALCAYYAVLNLIEFTDALGQKINLSQPQKVVLTVPVSFTLMGETVWRRALRLLNDNRSALVEVWRGPKADKEAKLASWKQWEAVMGDWINQVYRGARWHWSPFHTPFVKSL